jgi:hypothetical protein
MRLVTLGLVAAVACASAGGRVATGPSAPASDGSVASLPGLPAGILPGYVIHVTQLTSAALSTDSLDPSSLDVLLSQAGLQAGTQTRFTARGKRLTEVVARVLRFGSAAGADAYLVWLRAHAVDLLGSRTRGATPPGFPGAIAIRHGPSGCCTKDTFQYFAAWTRGGYAFTLLIGGPAAGPRTATPLAHKLDASLP